MIYEQTLDRYKRLMITYITCVSSFSDGKQTDATTISQKFDFINIHIMSHHLEDHVREFLPNPTTENTACTTCLQHDEGETTRILLKNNIDTLNYTYILGHDIY